MVCRSWFKKRANKLYRWLMSGISSKHDGFKADFDDLNKNIKELNNLRPRSVLGKFFLLFKSSQNTQIAITTTINKITELTTKIITNFKKQNSECHLNNRVITEVDRKNTTNTINKLIQIGVNLNKHGIDTSQLENDLFVLTVKNKPRDALPLIQKDNQNKASITPLKKAYDPIQCPNALLPEDYKAEVSANPLEKIFKTFNKEQIETTLKVLSSLPPEESAEFIQITLSLMTESSPPKFCVDQLCLLRSIPTNQERKDFISAFKNSRYKASEEAINLIKQLIAPLTNEQKKDVMHVLIALFNERSYNNLLAIDENFMTSLNELVLTPNEPNIQNWIEALKNKISEAQEQYKGLALEELNNTEKDFEKNENISDDEKIAAIKSAHENLKNWETLSPEVKKLIPNFDLRQRKIQEKFSSYEKDLELMHAIGIACIERDSFQDAREYLKKAADGGHVEAALMLAKEYTEGRGGPIDLEQASSYFELGKSAGGPLRGEIAYQLGRMYESSKEMSPNPIQAEKYLLLAANDGLLSAKQQLMNFYLTSGNKTQANFWKQKWRDQSEQELKNRFHFVDTKILSLAVNSPDQEKRFKETDANIAKVLQAQVEEAAPVLGLDKSISGQIMDAEFPKGGVCFGMTLEFIYRFQALKEGSYEERVTDVAKKYETRSGITATALQALYESLMRKENKVLLSAGGKALPNAFEIKNPSNRQVTVIGPGEKSELVLEISDIGQENMKKLVPGHYKLVEEKPFALLDKDIEKKMFGLLGKKISPMPELVDQKEASNKSRLEKWMRAPDGEFQVSAKTKSGSHSFVLLKNKGKVYLWDPSSGGFGFPKAISVEMIDKYLVNAYGIENNFLQISRIESIHASEAG